MDLVAAEYKSKTRWRVDVHQEPGVVHKTLGLWPDTFFHHLYEVSNQPLLLYLLEALSMSQRCVTSIWFQMFVLLVLFWIFLT